METTKYVQFIILGSFSALIASRSPKWESGAHQSRHIRQTIYKQITE